MKNTELDSRLMACADFVRRGSVAADIGSDHAYLPIYLVKNGICPKAIASDVNKGPINRAKINIAEAGLEDKICTLLADGLDKASVLCPDDIIIAGMGGELIRDILNASEYVKNKDVRLILQPMTMSDVLREYLYVSGYDILDEKVCVAAGKCYQIICAHFDGVSKQVDTTELTLGLPTIAKIKSGNGGETEKYYIEHTKRGAQIRLHGMENSKEPDTALIDKEKKLILLCDELLKHFKEDK